VLVDWESYGVEQVAQFAGILNNFFSKHSLKNWSFIAQAQDLAGKGDIISACCSCIRDGLLSGDVGILLENYGLDNELLGLPKEYMQE
jgi:hypothetical protein